MDGNVCALLRCAFECVRAYVFVCDRDDDDEKRIAARSKIADGAVLFIHSFHSVSVCALVSTRGCMCAYICADALLHFRITNVAHVLSQ